MLQLCPFRVHQVRILRKRGERHDRIQNVRRFAECFCVRADFFFPRFPVQRERCLRLNRFVRLLMRKIRSTPFQSVGFYFLAGANLDQRFRGSAILIVRLQPNRASHDFLIVVYGNCRSRPAAWHLPLAYFVRVIQRVGSRSNRHLQPAVPRFAAR